MCEKTPMQANQIPQIEVSEIHSMSTVERATWNIEARKELDWAMLIAEDETGAAYQPVGVVSTIEEAIEIAQSDFNGRNPDDDLCPYCYAIWERRMNGYVKTSEILLN